MRLICTVGHAAIHHGTQRRQSSRSFGVSCRRLPYALSSGLEVGTLREESAAKAKAKAKAKAMSYDEVEIEDMEWSEELQAFTYPCPCGDLFQITREDLRLGDEIARCPSCSLYITVVYNPEDFADPPDPKRKATPAQPIAVA